MVIFLNIMLIVGLIYLIWTSIWDIIRKQTPILENLIMLALSLITYILAIINGKFVSITIFLMIVFLLLIWVPTLLKKQGIGDAEAYTSWLALSLSMCFITEKEGYFIFGYGYLVSLITFIFYAFIRNAFIKKVTMNERIPFFPFITIGYIVSLILYF